jgi:serine/threonine-protein kinase
VVGAYVVGEAVGRGSTAVVHVARRADGGGGEVALKLLHASVAVTVGVERFLREIRLASVLTHPNIVPVLDSGREGGRPWYAMPLYRRGTLRDRLARGGPLPLAQARALAGAVAAALQRAHDAGVVHRDVKPENLFVADDGRVLIADFGVARAFGDRDPDAPITAAGMTVGTPRYMSPEQLRGDPNLDGATDQYALACVVHEAIVGVPAFGGDSMLRTITQRFTAPPPSARAARADVPKPVDAALRRALAIQPELRWPTVRALALALGA